MWGPGGAATALAGRLRRRSLELRLGLRMTAAGLLAFAVAELLCLAQGYWAVLTAVIVTQTSLGGSLKAMLDRLVGTIGGAICGIAATLIVPRGGPAPAALALVLALVPVAVLVAFKPAYRVAPVTAVIIVPGSPGSSPVLHAGLERTFEIGLGSLAALVVALLVLLAARRRTGAWEPSAGTGRARGCPPLNATHAGGTAMTGSFRIPLNPIS